MRYDEQFIFFLWARNGILYIFHLAWRLRWHAKWWTRIANWFFLLRLRPTRNEQKNLEMKFFSYFCQFSSSEFLKNTSIASHITSNCRNNNKFNFSMQTTTHTYNLNLPSIGLLFCLYIKWFVQWTYNFIQYMDFFL